MSQSPAAFFGYARIVDQHDEGYLTELRRRLEGEVRIYLGDEFSIFQDRKIGWGEEWKKRIDEVLDGATFFIPVLTPAFFKSPYCREELETFLEREKKLGRRDLILPIYYVDDTLFNDTTVRADDPLAEALAARQYADWRDLRFELLTDPRVGRRLAEMAVQIREALDDTSLHVGQGTGRRRPEIATHPMATHPPEGGTEGQISEGPRPIKEPPTHLVDPLHRGEFVTISAAIEVALPGDRILVRPGLYLEGLVMDKPLEILGDGPVEQIVVRAKGANALLFRTTMGRVKNLSLQQIGGGDRFGVDIGQGRLELEDCDIRSDSLACVSIHHDADPRLLRNRIHGGKSGGVLVEENGQGTLEDNEIFDNAFVGVEIRKCGHPTLRRNRIHHGGSSGMLVQDGARGVVEDNEIFENARSGVEICEGGNPTLRRNRVHSGRSAGVLVHKGGKGSLEDNEIYGNNAMGIEVREGGDPTLRRNRIHHNGSYGIRIHSEGRGLFEENEVYDHARSGVIIKSGSDPTLRLNKIHDNKECGVSIREDGRGLLEDNEVFGNSSTGVEVQGSNQAMIRRNRIYQGNSIGVVFQDSAQGTLEENEIHEHRLSGLMIKSGGNPLVHHNRIHHNKEAGIYVLENGLGVLQDNEISANSRAGVEIRTAGNPVLRRNRITENAWQAVRIAEGGGGTFEKNDLRGNSQGAWKIDPGCEKQVKRSGNLE